MLNLFLGQVTQVPLALLGVVEAEKSSGFVSLLWAIFRSHSSLYGVHTVQSGIQYPTAKQTNIDGIFYRQTSKSHPENVLQECCSDIVAPCDGASSCPGERLKRGFLYIGAGWDTFPLVFPALRRDHTHFIYVDSLPQLQHYQPHQLGWHCSQSTSALVSAVTQSLTRDWVAPIVVTVDEKYATFLCDGLLLHYFMNTQDTAMTASGFTPAPSVYDCLPALSKIYRTNDFSEIPSSQKSKIMPPLVSLGYSEENGCYLVRHDSTPLENLLLRENVLSTTTDSD